MKKLWNSIVGKTIVPFIGTIIICYSSCKKKENNDVSGKIEGYAIDLINSDSVPNAEVQLWEDDRGGTSKLDEFDRMLASVYTDNNGYYKIFYTGSKLKYYGIRAIKKNYSDKTDLATFGVRTEFKINYNLSPLSWLKIQIKNLQPTQITDSIYFFQNISLTGQYVDTTFYREFETKDRQLDIWDITENGVTTRYSKATNCIPFDTCQLNILY